MLFEGVSEDMQNHNAFVKTTDPHQRLWLNEGLLRNNNHKAITAMFIHESTHFWGTEDYWYYRKMSVPLGEGQGFTEENLDFLSTALQRRLVPSEEFQYSPGELEYHGAISTLPGLDQTFPEEQAEAIIHNPEAFRLAFMNNADSLGYLAVILGTTARTTASASALRIPSKAERRARP